ncbi:hypothetical protein MRB53_003977 [Persea americana]|uniref:Uncharacterized protein n=1 Tax=Persea americana TaxID=3435 RepID=A0ACC2N0M8_PERAE|nr:hypothetical protein MRB53_003977 [Persea americana]
MKKGKGNALIPFFSPICVIHLSSASTNISPAILLNCGVPSSSVVEGSVGLEKGQGQLLLGAGLVEEYQGRKGQGRWNCLCLVQRIRGRGSQTLGRAPDQG